MILPSRNAVHLYRALLREASYLFDPLAQSFHKEHIRWSFRRQQAKQAIIRAHQTHDAISLGPSQRESRQLKRARHYLSTLQRANQGYVGAVKNVLRTTYARKGKARSKVISGIMTPPSADDPTTPAAPIKYTQEWRPPKNFSKLLALQNRVHSHLEVSGRKLKEFPQIPEKNRWNRPFPKSRVKGIIQKWYQRHASLLMVPLQETQWLEIFKNATGQIDSVPYKIPQRRPVGAVRVFAEEEVNPEWMGKLDGLLRTSAQRNLRNLATRTSIGNPHKMTNRFMRRMTQQTVLQNTPTILVSKSTGKLATRWESGSKPHAIPSACTESQQVALFD